MKIDIFPHIVPPRFGRLLEREADSPFLLNRWDQVIRATPCLSDLDLRFRAMDGHEGLVQVLTLSSPPLEEIARPQKAAYLANRANDEMAELVATYPDRFLSAVASLPLNDPDAALRETERAIVQLGFRGVQIFTPAAGKPLDAPEFKDLYQEMVRYDLPIWVHPTRGRGTPDYRSEDHSRYWVFQMFGWPYETSVAMARLVFSGILEEHPSLKVITHHCGGMIPYFARRIGSGQDYAEKCLKARFKAALRGDPMDCFRAFYADTALNGHSAGLMCGYRFFGAEHILFGTDMPYDDEDGRRSVRETIRSVEEMDIPEKERELIFEGNARRLMHLDSRE
ncbi:MAG: amidohydrolase family protein [Thermodesulfobacteriota bacterium]